MERAEPPVQESRAGRLGRLAGTACFALVVVLFTGTAAVQILLQVFGGRAAPVTSCEAGLLALTEGLERGRVAARAATGERESLARFRAALEPSWQARDHVEAACRDSAEHLEALELIDRLRAAEEHAVRYSAPRLLEDRRAAEALRERLLRRQHR